MGFLLDRKVALTIFCSLGSHTDHALKRLQDMTLRKLHQRGGCVDRRPWESFAKNA